MRRSLLAVLCIILVAMAASALARTPVTKERDIKSHVTPSELNAAKALTGANFRSVVQGTTYLATYTFDSGPVCVDEGFTIIDRTAQLGDFWHVDDFAGLGGGTSGSLTAPAGLQALWCGARPTVTVPLCGYASLPGYGNAWDQAFCSSAVTGTGVSVNFAIHWDSEPGYDKTYLEVDDATVAGENWVALGSVNGGIGFWDNTGTDTASIAVPDTMHGGSVSIRFHFTSDGAWSDEDGLWDTDGAAIIDDLEVTVTSGTGLPLEDFEGESVGATSANDWQSCTPAGYGSFAGLFPGSSLVQEDPCVSRLSCVWGFFSGSSFVYDCVTPAFVSQPVVPYGNAQGQFLNNEIRSSNIPWVGSGAEAELIFDVYRDLPLDNLIFFVWCVRSVVAACPGQWRDRNFVYHGGQLDWLRVVEPFGDLVEPGATDIQISLGTLDQCQVWCGVYGTGACHSHAPLFDNIDVIRLASFGPQWTGRDLDQFQDNFEEVAGPTAGTARADMANDIFPVNNLGILPGDSATVTVADPVSGLSTEANPNSGAFAGSKVFLYVNVQGPSAGTAVGNALSQNQDRWPVVPGSVTANGVTWYRVRLDTSFTNGASRTGAQPDLFCVDLNDNLFVAGDTINFFYGAENTMGVRTYFNVGSGPIENLEEAASVADEFTILPAGGVNNGGDILYVDGMNFRGAQPFFDTAFASMGLLDQVDRYDIRAPSSGVANHPGSRVNDVAAQLNANYRGIIWNTGNLSITIGDGTGNPEKSDDASMLFSFLEQLTNTGGVYVDGDDAPDQMKQSVGAGMVSLLSKYINYTLDETDHVDFGLGASPLGVGVAGVFTGDQLVAYGGCSAINDFDVMSASGASTVLMNYSGNGNTGGALLGQTTLNPNGFNVSFLLQGFSYHYIRDDVPAGLADRFVHMEHILNILVSSPPSPVGAGAAGKYSLAQNYPNPFNPTTTINYTLRERTNVSLKVYNVAGQLVSTLVDGVQNPTDVVPVTWNGLNDNGQSVSSGVYFYKLVTGDFTQTKKMVLLK